MRLRHPAGSDGSRPSPQKPQFIANRCCRGRDAPRVHSNADSSAQNNQEPIMIDRFFSAALTFGLLAAGTLAIASAWFEGSRPAAPVAALQAAPQVVQLPLVEVIGKRVDSDTAVARTDGTEPAVRKVQ
jgi:hypothetical protein